STPAVSTPAVSTPAVSTPAVSTPAVSTPAVSTPAVSTPAVSTPNSHRVTAPHPAITLSDISHEEASRSAMQYAAVLRDWALRKAAPEEVEKAPCTSEVALDLRKRSRVEEGGCSEGKRGKFHDTCVAD
ncbi:putative serum response factor-binding protein 1, partial [Gregarina niphandrodes]